MIKLLLIIVLTTLVFSISVCNKAPETSDGEKIKIALIMKSLANEFFLTMENGAKAHQKKNADKYDLICNGIKNETDIGGQIKLVEQMIAAKVDAIIIAAADSKALLNVLKQAIDANIKVVAIDVKFDQDTMKKKGMKIPFVGPDNEKGALKVGEYLVKSLKKGDQVAILEGNPGTINSQKRVFGFKKAMKKVGVKIVSSQTAHWDMNEANQIASAIITEFPNLKAILCANDSMALGAVAAVKAAGKTGKITVVGFDNISAVQSMIKQGLVLATVDQYGGKQAAFGIEYALELLTGKKIVDKETPVDLVTKDDLK